GRVGRGGWPAHRSAEPPSGRGGGTIRVGGTAFLSGISMAGLPPRRWARGPLPVHHERGEGQGHGGLVVGSGGSLVGNPEHPVETRSGAAGTALGIAPGSAPPLGSGRPPADPSPVPGEWSRRGRGAPA